MHPEAAAFERTILADPADRTPQLVYADWLDEHGDPEFATAIRDETFTRIPAVAAGSGVPLRAAWETSRGLQRLSGPVGVLGILAASLLPTVGVLGGSLRSAALGLALSGSPGRPPSAPVNQPQVRRVS